MMEKREYKSSVRSRKMIRNAFYELLKEKPFDKITVTDIVKRADINRSTFYAHFPDVRGVIEEIQEEILDYTQKFMEEIDFRDFYSNPKPYLQKIVKPVEDNNDLYRVLGTDTVATRQLEQIKAILIERTIATVDVPFFFKNKMELEFSIRFYICGVIDVYKQWLYGTIDCSLDELTDQLASMILKTKDIYFK